MDSHNVAFAPADDDHALRRVRSTGDIPDTSEGSSARPSRTYHPVGHLRRSEGQSSPLQPPPPAHPHMGLIIPLSPDARDTSPLGIPTDPLPRLAETPPATQPQHHQRRRPVRRGCLGALMTFLGYQGPNAAARKEVVGLVWNVSFASVQVCHSHSYMHDGCSHADAVCGNHSLAGVLCASRKPYETWSERVGCL